jgi:hypothetical protein
MKLLAPVALFFALVAGLYGVKEEVFPVREQADRVAAIKREIAQAKSK